MFENLKKGYRDLVSKFTPPPSQSHFYEKGTLTPEEFIIACNKLIQVNPIWKWGASKNDKQRVEYLPKDKQYIYADIVSWQRLNSQDDDCVVQEEDQENLNEKVKVITLDSDEEEHETENKTGSDNNSIRYYQVYITYDLYYHTPWFWIGGTDSRNNVLTKEQIFEEIMSDYVNKTATAEKCV